ncbi:Branched-chain amino acid transport system / permease component [Acididesulfobacillus acetoxydans]|uniref:Branched-chain amino acid transport system / permease component n=1 Tax=Acididesulfobacillus acetoxydans TaxID=1561005 RepID=A0A8S0XA06_9FIRM|nr:branched-chain amino acid ABC transporter permease [Acididesulfobacillus acetoxydans]CAA7599406.1 Branched-chain amino acid transport system / permease component [Acididesulfobacillus acetoxydans]CEJ06788.1 Branched-chain amino acid transport system permease protein LivH [Acididesulfobacillus acetoxydans]
MGMATFINLTVNGLSTGMMIFLLASGLSLIFGLMGVLNFAHGSLFMLGGYTGVVVFAHSGSFILALVSAMLVGVSVGWVVERLTVRRVYGNAIAQILITTGVMIVLNELVKAVFGPDIIATPVPPLLAGSWAIGSVILIKYRLFTLAVGLVVAVTVHLLLTKTRLGMVVRAGVENPEMVQALGINIRQVFSLVFAFGAALAALGGVMMAPAVGAVNPDMGLQNQMLAFIVVVIGGMGSFLGSALGSILVGLAGAYTAWFLPEASLAVNVLLMAVVLLLRPNGLFGMGGE